MQRRARSHHLFELGRLVGKAGLAELTGDDYAALLGGFLCLADQLRGEGRPRALADWRARGEQAGVHQELAQVQPKEPGR